MREGYEAVAVRCRELRTEGVYTQILETARGECRTWDVGDFDGFGGWGVVVGFGGWVWWLGLMVGFGGCRLAGAWNEGRSCRCRGHADGVVMLLAWSCCWRGHADGVVMLLAWSCCWLNSLVDP